MSPCYNHDPDRVAFGFVMINSAENGCIKKLANKRFRHIPSPFKFHCIIMTFNATEEDIEYTLELYTYTVFVPNTIQGEKL